MVKFSSVSRAGFSLIELLVVIAVIGVLIAITVPAIERANEKARLAVCGQNLHQIAVAISTYAGENSNAMPIGPAVPSAVDPTRPDNTLGTNLLKIGGSGEPTGLGLLVRGGQLVGAKVLACPSDDDKTLAPNLSAMLATGTAEVRGSYAYRQLDQTKSNRLHDPGVNGLGNPARAIAFDWQCEGTSVWAHGSHDLNERFNIMFTDGHVQDNFSSHEAMTVDASDFAAMPGSFVKRVDQLWVTADYAETGLPEKAPKLP